MAIYRGGPHAAADRPTSRSCLRSRLEPPPDRFAMGGQILGLRQRDDVTRNIFQGGLVVLDKVDALEERLNGQSAGMAGTAGRRQHMVGTGAVVAEADRSVRSDEYCARRTDPGRHLSSVDRLDFEMLRGVSIDDADTRVEVVDQHDRGLLAAQ